MSRWEEVKPIGFVSPNESQARELARAPPENRADAWEAVETAPNGKVTATHHPGAPA
jgi:hypothetical protein